MGAREVRLVSMRSVFMLVVAIGGLLVFYDPLVALLPTSAVDLLQRNNEAYLFFILMILDVEVVAPRSRRTVRPGWWLWLGILALAWATTYLWGQSLGLPQEIITLNEVFPAVIILSIYLTLTRRNTGSVSAVWPRIAFYTTMAALAVLGEVLSGGPADALAAILVDYAETFGFALLIGFLFDWVEKWPDGPRWQGSRRWAWYAFLVAVPVLYTKYNPPHAELPDATGLVDSGIAWLQRVTEAFVAALLMSVFNDLPRRSRDAS